VKFNQTDKKKGCLELLNEMKVKPKNVAYIGDDESDIPCCLLIPFSFAVNNSHQDLKQISRFHLKEKGGEGVINGFIENLNLLSTNPKI
jgi:3-deoxy-D-manno-octulosonate 8-phosphate phosphatase KdsC-like HAD superfamily phosphatase